MGRRRVSKRLKPIRVKRESSLTLATPQVGKSSWCPDSTSSCHLGQVKEPFWASASTSGTCRMEQYLPQTAAGRKEATKCQALGLDRGKPCPVVSSPLAGGVSPTTDKSSRLLSPTDRVHQSTEAGLGLPQRGRRMSLQASETPGKPTLPPRTVNFQVASPFPKIRLCQEIPLRFQIVHFEFLPVLTRNTQHAYTPSTRETQGPPTTWKTSQCQALIWPGVGGQGAGGRCSAPHLHSGVG